MGVERHPIGNETQSKHRKMGENFAANFLSVKAISSLPNWKSPYGELDLIARKEDTIVIVEVKTRTGSTFGWPEESITPLKQEHILNASLAFFDEHTEYSDNSWQIDVIAIQIGSIVDHKFQIKHYENAITSL